MHVKHECNARMSICTFTPLEVNVKYDAKSLYISNLIDYFVVVEVG